MDARTKHYLETASRYPKYAWEESRETLSELPEHLPAPVRQASRAQIAAVAIAALCIAAGIYYGADLVRYLQMRRM